MGEISEYPVTQKPKNDFLSPYFSLGINMFYVGYLLLQKLFKHSVA